MFNRRIKLKKSGFKWSYIFIALLVVLCLVFLFSDTGVSGTKISADTAILYVKDGKVSNFYAKDGIAKIKLKENSQVSEEKFPAKADYYFKYTSETIRLILEVIDENNELAKTDDSYTHIKWDYEPTEPSILEQIAPFLYIGLGLLVIFIVFKMLSSSNKGAMAFGKSRAKISTSTKVRFSDIAGADEEKEELKEIVDFLKNPQKFTALGARIPKGVLLVGPPGTGKTLLARAVAGESNVPFLSISGSDFVEMFVGVGASRVRDLFEDAKKSMPCIVFIDEIDAVGRQRGAGLGGGNDEREQTLNQLLVEMDGFESNDGIIVLAATNRSDVLDPALLRPGRFDRQIYVHIPDVKGREGIIKIHARNKPIDEEVDFETLARITSGFTGADIENMLNEAAILAARANRAKIIMEDLTEGINKVIMGPQKKSRVITENDKKITAYHESGHAILGKLLPFCEPIQEVSIIPRGNAAGYTMSRPENDDSHRTFNRLNDEIAMIMGGRIAEEIVFKDVTTGASSDIQKATEIARKMVTDWGMSSLGFMGFNNDNQLFIGRDYQRKNDYSEKMASEIDKEVKNILDYNYKRAKDILTKNITLLDNMSNLLLQKETIYHDEVELLIEGHSVDEIVEIMNKKEEERRKKQQAQKEQQSIMLKMEELENKVKTGEMFLKNGIITQADLNILIKKRDEFKESLQNQKAEKSSVKEDSQEQEKEKKVSGRKKSGENKQSDNEKKTSNKKKNSKDEEDV